MGVSPMLLAETLENYDIFEIFKIKCCLNPETLWGMLVASVLENDFDSYNAEVCSPRSC